MITERLMRPGQWSLALHESIPQSVRDQVVEFGHIVVTSTPVVTQVLNDAAVFSFARYTGVVRRVSEDEISGAGLLIWLGDEQGKGELLEAAINLTAQALDVWVNALVPPSLGVGTVTNPPGTLTHRAQYITPREALDYVVQYFGAEYKVRPNGAIDAGEASDLFTITPDVMVVPRSGGRDPAVLGLLAKELDRVRDVEDYTTRTLVLAKGEGTSIATGSADLAPTTPYKDLNGNDVVMTRIVDSPSTQAGNENAVAAGQLAQYSDVRKEIRLSTEYYDIGGAVEPGDNVWVHDPELGFEGGGDEVHYRGEVTSPIRLRVLGSTWPVEPGMGVYYRAGDGTYVDISSWTALEAGPVTLEVGAAARTLFSAVYNAAAVIERASR